MSKTPNEERFIYMANLLREYININKTAPRLYDLYKGENIGLWFATQRRLYKEGNLLQNRILILENAVGEFYSSEITYREKRFIYMTNLLKEYIDTYKMLPKKTDIYKGENIGSWFITKRKLYREGKLSQNRINILESTIGKFYLEITYKEQHFIYMANLLKEYININNIFPKSGELYKGENIGLWFITQRKFYREGKLLQNRINILENAVGKFYLEITYKEQHFIYMVKLLKEYMDLNNTPPKQREVYKGIKIGYWYNNQKGLFTKGLFSKNKISILKEIDPTLKLFIMER